MLAKVGAEEESVCVWCRETRRGLFADFSDGLKGFFCWKDFRKAVKVRSSSDSNKDSGNVSSRVATHNSS